MKRYISVYLLSAFFGALILMLNFLTAIALSRSEIDVAILFGAAQLILYIAGITVHVLWFQAMMRYQRHVYKTCAYPLADDSCLCDLD